MNKVEWLEDYTNAVIAIVITLMVLDIHAPTGHFFSDILRANDHFLTYIYSFLLISMYWVNHGRLFSGLKHLKSRRKFHGRIASSCFLSLSCHLLHLGLHAISTSATRKCFTPPLCCALTYRTTF